MWPVFNIKISTYDMLNGLEQFLHGCPMAGSEIQGVARASIQEMLDLVGMRIGKIENVDKVAHAGSITRIIVRAQNAHSDDRDQSFQRIATHVTRVRDGAVGCSF